MHIEFLVEEPSAEAALKNLVPRIVPEIEFKVITYQGKPDLLSKLPQRLKGYRRWIKNDWRIVVLIDKDREDCEELKQKLERFANDASLVTKTNAGKSAEFQVLNRISIEELEAWFFGDVVALHRAYPKIHLSLGTKSKYRDPDAILGGTWEALEKELQRKGYFHGGLAKIEAAKAISAHMDPARNRSKSFQVFRDGLIEMANFSRS
ncbi:MAG TPA: DUF4276 family protein [Methanothrix sp.]|jgi:hypothetical protein|nr:DUF4276 family protein [Methanothrix sp.]